LATHEPKNLGDHKARDWLTAGEAGRRVMVAKAGTPPFPHPATDVFATPDDLKSPPPAGRRQAQGRVADAAPGPA
jgi:hypothetical protein